MINLQTEINKCDQKIYRAIADGDDLKKQYWQGRASAFSEVLSDKHLNQIDTDVCSCGDKQTIQQWLSGKRCGVCGNPIDE